MDEAEPKMGDRQSWGQGRGPAGLHSFCSSLAFDNSLFRCNPTIPDNMPKTVLRYKVLNLYKGRSPCMCIVKTGGLSCLIYRAPQSWETISNGLPIFPDPLA